MAIQWRYFLSRGIIVAGPERDKLPVAGSDLTIWEYRIKVLVAEVLEERSTVDAETHRMHHEYIQSVQKELTEYLTERRRSRERWDSIKNTAIGTLVVSTVGGILGLLAWIGKLVLIAIQHHPQEVMPK